MPGEVEAFRFEDDEAFEVALEIARLGDDIARRLRSSRPWAAFQLGKASLSVMNNTAEAHGEKSPGDKARLYRYASRSATETAAMVVLFARSGVISTSTEHRLRPLLLQIMKILTRRALHFQSQSKVVRSGVREEGEGSASVKVRELRSPRVKRPGR